jgi:hypothetical protein
MYKEVLTILKSELNFTTRQYKRLDGAWGSVIVDTSTGTLLSTGILADVMSGNADMIATALDIGIQRSLVVDFLPPISYDYAALIILNDDNFDELEFDSYFHPLSNQIWVAIVILALCISVFMYLVKIINTEKKYKTVSSVKKTGLQFLLVLV